MGEGKGEGKGRRGEHLFAVWDYSSLIFLFFSSLINLAPVPKKEMV